GSKLALWQADFIKKEVEKRYKNLSVQIKIIKTKGDKILDSPLSKIGGKGVFVKEIENALIESIIDMAVHSVKDVPTDIPSELDLAAIIERVDPREVLISKENVKLVDLPKNSTIATGSLRRRAQILSVREDFNFVDIRGNVDTRLTKFYQSSLQGIILAKAGVERMGFGDKISEVLSEDICLPAAGQGAIGIEIRKDDEAISEIARNLNHKSSQISIKAERTFLKRLGGGCQVPIGVLARVVNNKLLIKGVLSDLMGKKIIKKEVSGEPCNPETIGILLAEKILNSGGEKIIKEFE
ncbi:MAG: hydroxymethylbilane synthase, partial [Candidatus Helarchaeota archaeon]|nr:hydroxymethylbilane synthase [Candidatus Helarchaeota archaeon]